MRYRARWRVRFPLTMSATVFLLKPAGSDEAGRSFQSEAGHHSGSNPAALPI